MGSVSVLWTHPRGIHVYALHECFRFFLLFFFSFSRGVARLERVMKRRRLAGAPMHCVLTVPKKLPLSGAGVGGAAVTHSETPGGAFFPSVYINTDSRKFRGYLLNSADYDYLLPAIRDK